VVVGELFLPFLPLFSEDTGGEVKDAALGRLLHHLLEGRCTGLFWCFSPKPTSELDDIHRGSSSNMIQVAFAQTNIT